VFTPRGLRVLLERTWAKFMLTNVLAVVVVRSRNLCSRGLLCDTMVQLTCYAGSLRRAYELLHGRATVRLSLFGENTQP
jgi:hypothetical protein